VASPFDNAGAFNFAVGLVNNDVISQAGHWADSSRLSPGLRYSNGTFVPINASPWDGEAIWLDDQWDNVAVAWLIDSGTETIGIKLRSDITALSTYYYGEWHGQDSSWHIYKRVGGGSPSLIADTGASYSIHGKTFDRIGFVTDKDQISLWHQERIDGTHPQTDITAAWTQILSVTDSAISGLGYMCLAIEGLGADTSVIPTAYIARLARPTFYATLV
jgi:hypothetical protein